MTTTSIDDESLALLDQKIEDAWQNDDNVLIYNKLPLEEFYNTALKGGLDTGCDVDLILPYIHQAKSILEIGAGYGRVLMHLINSGYMGRLTAIERIGKSYQWLNSNFSRRVQVVHTDLKSFKTEEQFDLILWLWTGITEFSQDEQLPMLRALKKLLTKGGKLILDNVSPIKETLNTKRLEGHHHVIETKHGNDYCYVPSDEEVRFYAEKLDLKIVQKLNYCTTVGRERILYILSN